MRGLRKAYGDNVAVDGVDLDVHRGEVFALLGPNGAGKTTTVEILEGLPAARRRRGRGARRRPGARRRAPGGRGSASCCRAPASSTTLTVARGGAPLRRLLPATPTTRTTVIERVGLADKRGARTQHAVRRAEAPPRRGAGHHRPARAALPRRADDRLRPGGAPRVLGADPRARRRRHHDPAHHALPGGGRGAGRPGRRASPAAGWSRSTPPRGSATGGTAAATVGWHAPDGPRQDADATPRPRSWPGWPRASAARSPA